LEAIEKQRNKYQDLQLKGVSRKLISGIEIKLAMKACLQRLD
jgi:hypothetical protein